MADFTGGLKFQVFNGGVALPVSNAKIELFDEEGTQLLRTLFTNEDGETDIIELPAPDEIYSTSGGGKPYSSYNAIITADGIGGLEISGIQVFPDVIGIQLADPVNGEQNFITIPAPSLWTNDAEKIPEEEVKPLPDDEGFVVLDRVVIPEFVVPCFLVVVITCYNLLKRDVYRVF